MCHHGVDREGFYTVAFLLSCLWDSLKKFDINAIYAGWRYVKG
jgi:hypothetical protein